MAKSELAQIEARALELREEIQCNFDLLSQVMRSAKVVDIKFQRLRATYIKQIDDLNDLIFNTRKHR